MAPRALFSDLATNRPVSAPALSLMTELMADDMARVNQVILAQAHSEVSLIPLLARHIIASGGKRLRPALTLLSARLCGYNGARHVNLAACIEFLHTATLLHDDVVDESTLRRGNATANDLWGNQASVLVGDFLLGRAFQLMVGDGSLEVLRILSDTSAIIAEGEVLQMTTTGNPATPVEIYLKVIAAKTAALFAAAGEVGPVVAERPEWQETMREFGHQLGMAFQLVDDALDYTSSEATLGKTIGDDFREGKVTLPVILAYQRGSAEEKHFWQRTLSEGRQEEGDLAQAMQFIARHNATADTIAEAQSYCNQARSLLAGFPASTHRDALAEMVDFCAQRAY